MASKLYSKDEVVERLDVSEALEIVERTYLETAQDRVLNPAKLTMHMGDDGGWPDMNAFAIDMPAYVDWLKIAGMKWAIATWDADTDIPISSLILLFDPSQGNFTAIMEGMYLTAVRTALQSVVGLKYLSPTQLDSISVFGAGFQAKFQLLVIDELLDITEFKLFDINNERANVLASEVDPQIDAEIAVHNVPATTVESDAVVTVTDSKSPVLEERKLNDVGLVIALGSYRELSDETIHAADQVVVDHIDQCLQRGALADLASRDGLARDDIDATIGEVLNNGQGYSVRSEDRMLFVPIGLGSLDVAIAEHVRRSTATNRNTINEFDFE